MIDCDFIPTEYHQRRGLRFAIRRRAGFVGGLIAVMAIWLVAHHHRLSTADAMVHELDQQQRQIAVHQQEKVQMEARRQALADRKRLIDELGDGTSMAVIFSDISRHVPKSVVLTQVELNWPVLPNCVIESVDPLGNSAPPSSKAPATRIETELDPMHPMLRIIGIATAAPEAVEFAAALEGSPLFDRVRMDDRGVTVWGGRRARQFELTCALIEHRRRPS